MTLKLFYKLFGAFLFVALVPFLFASYIFTGTLEKYLHDHLYENGAVRLERTAILITDVVSHVEKVLARLARHIHFTDKDIDVIQWLYDSHPQIINIIVVDMNGIVHEAVSRFSYIARGTTLADCVPSGQGKKKVTFSSWNNEPTMIICYPIVSLASGKQVGALHAELSISSLFKTLSFNADKHVQYVVNGYNGHIVFHPDFNLVLNDRDASLLAPVKQALAGTDLAHEEYVNLSGDRVLGVAKSIAGVPFVLVEETPFTVAYDLIRQRRDVRNTILWSSIVFILITAYLLTRSITRPVARLLTLTRRIEQGDLDVVIPENHSWLPDEISIFSDHFQRMVEALKTDRQRRDEAVQKEQAALEKLSKSQKMEAIGLMAGGVAHDLNNILSGIVGYPELILYDLPKDSELRGKIEAIQESGQRAATIVADLLTVARGAASTREICDVNILIAEYLESPEAKKLKSLYPSIHYQQQLKATQTTILCSPVHVKKCIMNLAANAAEAISDDGTVVVSSRNVFVEDAATGKHEIEKGDYVVVSVEDTGPGIADLDIEHIFDPFYTRKVMGRSGTGLGLTVVWNTMEDHGGRVVVESSNKGTRFDLYFSLCEGDDCGQAEVDLPEMNLGNNESVLVVDDEPQLRDIATEMLRVLGYRVDCVESGELAVRFVKENPVDLLVIDMLMDPGMNGRQTYEKICKLYPGQKAVLVSGFSESDDVKATLRHGAGAFIKKPYSMAELGRAVKKVICG